MVEELRKVFSRKGSALIIETERLILRPLTFEDEADLLEYHSNAEVVRYNTWPQRNLEQVRAALLEEIPLQKESLENDGDLIILGWALKSEFKSENIMGQSGKVIGQSYLRLASKNDKRADIGYVTHQDFQQKGFAFEATDALLHYICANFDVHRVIADIDTRGIASARLAEKLGMRLEGTFQESEFFKGDWCDMWLYAILKSEYRN